MDKFEGRRKAILDVLRRKNSMSVHEASALINTSDATTRRFFSQLAAEGSVVRVHGGIELLPDNPGTYSYIYSNIRRVDQKERIAARAVDLVETSDLLFLDSGTTILKMAEAIARRLKTQEISGVVVVTNSLVSYEKLCPFCKVILIGGEVRLSRRDTFGPLAESALSTLHVHKAFFGVDAIHPQKGLMATDEWTCTMNGIVQRNAERVYVLADSEKFGRSSLLTYSGVDHVDLIITDDGIRDEELEIYRSRGANIDVVSGV